MAYNKWCPVNMLPFGNQRMTMNGIVVWRYLVWKSLSNKWNLYSGEGSQWLETTKVKGCMGIIKSQRFYCRPDQYLHFLPFMSCYRKHHLESLIPIRIDWKFAFFRAVLSCPKLWNTLFFIRRFFWPRVKTFLAFSWFQYQHFLTIFVAETFEFWCIAHVHKKTM